MDDGRFWIWEKQRGIHSLPMRGSTGHNLNTTDAQAGAQSLYDVSWEERAFAEDAAGPHGGCIWPPRSYSCNFCGREFRSAQALGGHMNVHRRDRARLKQSSLGSQDVFDHNHQPSQQLQHGSQSQKSSVTSHVATSQVCDLAYNSNPNPNHVSFMNMTAPTSLALKISSPSAATGYISLDQEPSTFDEDQLGLREAAGKLPWSNQNIQTTNLKMDANKRGPQILREGGLMHCDKPDISVSLNLFLFQTQATKRNENESTRDDDHHQDDAGSKRRKITATESLTMSSSYTKSRIVVDSGHDVQQKLVVVPGQQSSSSFIHEQLDLELRLGERSKVK